MVTVVAPAGSSPLRWLSLGIRKSCSWWGHTCSRCCSRSFNCQTGHQTTNIKLTVHYCFSWKGLWSKADIDPLDLTDIIYFISLGPGAYPRVVFPVTFSFQFLLTSQSNCPFSSSFSYLICLNTLHLFYFICVSFSFPHSLLIFSLLLSFLLSMSSFLPLPFPILHSVTLGLPSPFLFCNYAFVFTLSYLSCLCSSLRLQYVLNTVCNTLPSSMNSLFPPWSLSLDFNLSIFHTSCYPFVICPLSAGWAEFWHGPSHQASPVENHLWRSERKMCRGPHLSQVSKVSHTYTCYSLSTLI